MISVGISSACLYPMLTEDAIKLLVDNEVNHTEIFFNSFSELSSDFIGGLRRTLIPAGVSVEAIHPFSCVAEPLFLFSSYKRRFEDSLDQYRRYFEAAQLLKCHKFVLHGDRADRHSIDEKEYFERYARLCEVAKAYGVSVLQENVSNFRSRSPEFIKNMSEYLGDGVDFTFDVKQCIRAGVDPFEMFDAMGKKIRHVHLSDNDEGHDCLIAGQGSFDIPKLFDRLYSIGYDGAVLLEVYRHNFKEEKELFEGLSYIKQFVKSEGNI